MSAKFIYKMSDENPDLRKQIGCMNGIFQLFDRHHFLGGSRRVNGHNHKRLPPGRNYNQEAEDKNAPPKSIEKKHKTVKDKQRNSTESSRTSFSSSSCSSSFTSVECSKACQLEAPSSGQTIAPETQAWKASIHASLASLSRRQSLDLRDVVKESINRESHGLSIRTPTKGEAYGQTLKYIDSPRPLQSPKSVNSGIKESFQVLHKLKESPRKSNEKNNTWTSAVKDARRFSCDGRESRSALKSTNKLKELPRLSLDSKAGSMRSSAEMKSSSISRESVMGNGSRSNSLNQQEALGSCQRASSVVARLMGLEALPDSMSTDGNETIQFDAPSHGTIDAYMGLSRTVHENKQKQFSSSLRYRQKEPTSQCLTNAFSTRKPTASSKFPIEPAPWKQVDGNRSSQRAASKNMVTAIKQSNSLSVYGEIEKKLSQLEFKRSGKDLRALKQILEAMQKNKEVLETRNEASNYASQTSSGRSPDQRTKDPDLPSTRNNSPFSALAKGNSSPKSLKSPIVIMKPAKLFGKPEKTASSGNLTESLPSLHRLQTSNSTNGRKEAFNQRDAKDTTPRTNPSIHSGQSPCSTSKSGKSRRLQQTSKDSKFIGRANETTRESSVTINEKQYQNRLVQEKQHHPGSMPPDSNRIRKQSSRQPTHSGSPRGKPREKSSKLQRNDDELSDISSGIRDLYHQVDAISLQSDSNISFASQIDEEVSRTDQSRKIDGPLLQQANWKRKDQAEGSSTEKVVAEQPSPVSVLDATFYSEELPSPIKKKSVAFKDDEALIPDDKDWNQINANYSTRSTNSSVNSMIDYKKVEVIQILVQNVRHLLFAHEGAINHEITPHYDSTNPDHKYIYYLLIVSGLLRDFDSCLTMHLHPTGYPIDPNLFTVLEQAKVTTKHLEDHSCKSTTQSEAQVTSRRKLIFDVVNEILLHKLLSESSSKDTVSPNMLGGKTSQGQQLLQELCYEVDRLQGIHSNCCSAEEDDYVKGIIRVDLMHHSSNWTAYRSDPWLVLDVERLIFKDLICEIFADETHAARHRRQLFTK